MAWASRFSDLNAVGAQTNVQIHGTVDTTSVAELFPGMPNVKVVGVVIAKGDKRHFISKKDGGSERCVLSFILRDSAIDFINVSCWGSEQYVNSMATCLHIGQVVELINACVQVKPTDGSDEKFKPWTPSMYHLSVNENRGEVKPCDEWTIAGYARLVHVPVKPHNDYYTISDIITNGQDMNGDIVSIMAVVKQVGPARDMKSKNGRQLRKCEVKLFDDTSSDFILILWDEELINLSQTWDPKESVLFAADVRVSFDEFKKTMVATAIGKTVITVNPETREAHGLYQYARSIDLNDLSVAESLFDGGHQNVNLAEIDKVYTVSEVISRMASSQSDSDDPVRGITYVCFTSFDIDGSSSSFLIRRCSRCRMRFSMDTKECSSCRNQGSATSSVRPTALVPEAAYDIRVSLSDHTGTVSNCIMAGPIAEKVLGFTAEEFEKLDDQKKTELKWQFLLERCKIFFQMTFPSPGRQGRPVLRILDCTLANIDEMARLIEMQLTTLPDS